MQLGTNRRRWEAFKEVREPLHKADHCHQPRCEVLASALGVRAVYYLTGGLLPFGDRMYIADGRADCCFEP